MSEDQHLTVEEAAERLSLSEETVRRWLRTGKLKGTRLGERRTGWRVPLSGIQGLLAASSAARASPRESGRLMDPLRPERSDLRRQALDLAMDLGRLISTAEILLASSRVRGTPVDAEHALQAVRGLKEAYEHIGRIEGDPETDPPDLHDTGKVYGSQSHRD